MGDVPECTILVWCPATAGRGLEARPGEIGHPWGGATDIVTGGDGNDVLDPINRPAGKDLVTCGSGFDRVLADRLDVVAPDCERVAVGLAAVLRLDHRIEESGFYDRLFEGLAPFPEG
jgi:hypothetical protein